MHLYNDSSSANDFFFLLEKECRERGLCRREIILGNNNWDCAECFSDGYNHSVTEQQKNTYSITSEEEEC
jgi:hypothetical protein